jgi:hypothetical protein
MSDSHWADQIFRVTIEWLQSRVDALCAEKKAIKTELPLHNKVGALKKAVQS